MGEKIATRAAYGETLAALGERYPDMVEPDRSASSTTRSG